jgi:hypothetical protein
VTGVSPIDAARLERNTAGDAFLFASRWHSGQGTPHQQAV